jgi:RHS repeat-associated protein
MATAGNSRITTISLTDPFKTPEQFTYDADGNLISDGRWVLTWDAENRLLSVMAKTNLGLPRLLKFEYDSKGRRIHKQVWNNTNGTGTAVLDLKFIYDGWSLVAELDALSSSTQLRAYTWGLDLSGSMQGAGGVGGLLGVSYHGSSTTNCFVASDGNGNVRSLINAADGASVAQYEDGPFGELLRATGPLAKLVPVRFSTKYQDDETDLLYYGLRYYSLTLGGWASRDPLTDQSPLLEGPDPADDDDKPSFEPESAPMRFVNNNPISSYDAVGLWPSSSPFLGFFLGGIPLTHQNANQRELPISSDEMIMVNEASKFVDTSQDAADSYMHAMRDGTAHQPDSVARAKANQFVREHLSKAEDFLCICQEHPYDALWEFGLALHTVQDSTSPAHNGRHKGVGPIQFKPWHGLNWWNPINDARALKHVIKENFDPDYGSRLDVATADLWKYFQCKTSAPPFPADFFTYGIDLKDGGYDN